MLQRNKEMKTTVILLVFILISLIILVRCDDDDDEYDLGDDEVQSNMKCLVCRATIQEMQNVIKKVDPRRKVEISGFRLDGSGSSGTRSVQYSKSETFLSELMESICEEDKFTKVRLKILKKIVVSQMLANQGALDITPDGDMSKSLNHFCLEILEDNEEAILKHFMTEVTPKNIDHIICTKTAKYCDAAEDDHRNEL